MKTYDKSRVQVFVTGGWLLTVIAACCVSITGSTAYGASSSAQVLPAGVEPVWDISRACHQATATRERICINGLWKWQPSTAEPTEPPAENWGYFKVPGCWPGITDYMEKDSQTVYAHPAWKNLRFGVITAAWYEREITIPTNWTDRKVALSIEYLNSHAVVFIDGVRVGETRFPAGEVDLTSTCRPGTVHRLSLFVAAMPLKGVMLSYTDTASARQVKGSVARRGLCGDVYLMSTPIGPHITDVKVDTSVRRKQLTFETAIDGISAGARYVLCARITQDGRIVKQFSSSRFQQDDLRESRITCTIDWIPDRLWDIHTPQNMWNIEVSLLDADDVLDTTEPIRFGFREFWIDGRDFYLNGSRIFLCAVPLDNAQVSSATATYEAARESMERLKSFGINFVYTHNYGCEPGSHLSFSEILRAADDVGMLVSFSQPHFSHYDWQAPDANETNGYARHAEFYVRAAQNHPGVVAYSMSHNATGYSEDMNPDMIDGIQAVRDTWAVRNVQRALRAEAIVHRLDSSRIVYHHASGNLGSMHISNFYPNFVPIQELSDWFEHWATKGVKPAFMCEYGAPFTWDWTMYRGWYKGKREFGSAVVPWDFCLAEWNAQFLGDSAFDISEAEKANLRWEAQKFRTGSVWHRWDYPNVVGSNRFDERYPVFAMYLEDNWRAFRTWGVSGISPWEYGHYWKLRDGVNRTRKPFEVDWNNLQRPGFSPDYIDQQYERMDLAFDRQDWIATPAAQALIRNSRPLLAWIAGEPGRFTGKDHNFLPGEKVEKQVIVINNSRETVTAKCAWSFDLPEVKSGSSRIAVTAGNQQRIPLSIALPADLQPGAYRLNMSVTFDTGETQEDRFTIHVLPPPAAPETTARIALFDPKGETAGLMADMGIRCKTIGPDADLSDCDILIIGKAALTAKGPAPDISRVQDGLKVIVFEQTAEALQSRLGFRVQQYGLRNVFTRVSGHPYLDGLDDEHLRDWRGESTILPSTLDYELSDKYNGAPAVRWCGLEVTRLWRCGNRGSVASVLIEKPAVGDFFPIVDGGFSLQYSPLLEYRQGKGMILFCQMDVTGRTQTDPAAMRLVRNILLSVSRTSYPVCPERKAFYIGDPDTRRDLNRAGIFPASCESGELPPDGVLIVGPGGPQMSAEDASAITRWLKAGGHLLALQLDAEQANAFLPTPIQTAQREHIASTFNDFGIDSAFAGVGPADVHNRDPRKLPLVSSGAEIIADGVLANTKDTNIVFCQLAPAGLIKSSRDVPELAPDDEDAIEGRRDSLLIEDTEQQNLRKTFRRSSFLLSRLLANMGVRGRTPLLPRFSTPAGGIPADSIVKNGGFRLDADGDKVPDDWQFSKEGKQATCVLESDGSLRITCPEPGANEKAGAMLAQHDIPMEKDHWYRISLRAKSEGLKSARINLALQSTKTWQPLFDYQRFSPGESWEEFVFLVQANATVISATRFQIWHDIPGVLWLSDIRIIPCDPPSHGRWMTGLYVDRPQEWDDPYRFFRW